MGAVTRRHALGLFGAAAVLSLLAACPSAPTAEPEDCDADDLLEGDDDCYGKRKPKPKSKPKPKRRR